MRPIHAWQHMMRSTVLVAARTGTDTGGYAKPTYGTDVAYRAHINRSPRLVRSATGQQVVSQQQIYLNSADAILPTARVTLTTGDVGSTESILLQPQVLAVERRFDQFGPHHTVIHTG